MKKDAYYFSHDANSQDDHKCMNLIDQLGMEGYGIFWALIEKLRCEKDYKLPLLACRSYAKRWSTSEQKILTVIQNFELFKVNDSMFFSLRLCRSMNEKSEKARISANLRWGNNASALQPHIECNADGMQNDAIKEKEIKVSIYPELESLNEKCKKYFDPKYIGNKSLKCFDELIRIDGYSIKEIQMAILNCRSDEFWTKQMMSPLKLRQKNKQDVKFIDVFLNLKPPKQSEPKYQDPVNPILIDHEGKRFQVINGQKIYQ